MGAVAIDLGTSFSSIAVWRNNKVEIIPHEEGSNKMPSYVAFAKNIRLIGQAAKNQASINPHNTIFGIKRIIGRRFDDVDLKQDLCRFPYSVTNHDGKPLIAVTYKGRCRKFAPEEISAMIISRLAQIAEMYLGEPVTKVFITVPGYFNDAQRQATRLAGVIAGLEVREIINEPTAAALYFGVSARFRNDRKILVYDLGGGTLNVSIVSINDFYYQVLASASNVKLGGENFDDRLLSYFIKDFQNRLGFEIDCPRSLWRLRIAAEAAKHCLSAATETSVLVEFVVNDINYVGRVSRARFEYLCSDLFAKILEPVEVVLQMADMEKSDIKNVVLVGGGTSIPKIRKLLFEFFGTGIILTDINPDVTTVLGAAIQAAIVSELNDEATKDLKLIDVVPLSLGVETCKGMMLKVIERNTPIPCSQVTELSTSEEFQKSMTIEIFEGERALTKDNHLLAVFQLDNIPPLPRGMAKIIVKFDVDSKGILTVTASDKHSDNSKCITVKNLQALKPEEINKMLREAREFSEEDLENKQRLEVRNQLESFIYDVKHSIKSNHDKVSKREYIKVMEDCKNAIAWLEYNEDCIREEYEIKMTELLLLWSKPLQKLNPNILQLQQNSTIGNTTAKHRPTILKRLKK